MHKMKYTIRTGLIYAAVALLASGAPMTAMAETVDSTPPASSVDAPAPVATAPDPAPVPAATRTPEKYTYNPQTQHWDSSKWAYNPTTGAYERVTPPPATQQQPVAPDPVATNEIQPSSADPQSASSINVDTNATINNTLNSNATTGNASVKQNTTAGNATTGDAAAVANIVNMMNSSVGGNGAEFATFVKDVVGDVHGDIMLYPMLLGAMLKAANTPQNDSTIGVTNNMQINNDINLNATTGDAAVKGNTNAGDATTGSANAVANVMNIINSIIAANQSFVGTVNIYGNLDGDILLAPDFLPQLLASNGGSSTSPNSLTVSANDTQSIVNNIDLNAASGNAKVANNTSAGNATTGDAKTNLVLLNLSGHQIVAKDSLLVFVNVLGKWVGIIVDAPSGTSAAALGTGVTSNNVAPDLTINVDNTSKIVNNLNLNAQSGDATVAGNTSAGNATTGNATASANVANVSGSQLGLTGWFGVLFINVFGSWLGSFGVDTARGNMPASGGGMGGTNSTPRGSAGPVSGQPFQFIAHTARASTKSTPFVAGQATPPASSQPAVADAADDSDVKGVAVTAASPRAGTPISQSKTGDQFDVLPFTVAALVIGLGMAVTRYIFGYTRGRRLTV